MITVEHETYLMDIPGYREMVYRNQLWLDLAKAGKTITTDWAGMASLLDKKCSMENPPEGNYKIQVGKICYLASEDERSRLKTRKVTEIKVVMGGSLDLLESMKNSPENVTLDDHHAVKEFASDFGDKEHEYYLALDSSSKLVGFAVVKKHENYLPEVFMMENCRKGGYGRQLVREIQKVKPRLYLQLGSGTNREVLARFYAGLGFAMGKNGWSWEKNRISLDDRDSWGQEMVVPMEGAVGLGGVLWQSGDLVRSILAQANEDMFEQDDQKEMFRQWKELVAKVMEEEKS